MGGEKDQSKESSKKRPREQWSTAPYLALVEAIRKADEMQMFHEPVRDEDVPGYSSVITDPTDLRTIREKLERTGTPSSTTGPTFKRSSDVLAEIRRMFENALEFNERGDPYYKHAHRLLKQLPKFVTQVGIHTTAEDDEDDKDGRDRDYVPTGAVHDSEASFIKAEKREDWKGTIKGLEDDLETPIEEIRARLAAAAAAAAALVSDDDGSGDDDSDDSDDELDSSSSEDDDSDSSEEDSEDSDDENDSEAS